MVDKTHDFKFTMPAELGKSSDGEWIVQGIASTASKDLQGETIMPNGIDASPIDQGKAYLNWDHQKGPEHIVGSLSSYKKTPDGLFIKGKLFKNHTKAKAIHEIMSSLTKSDKLKMGLSVEGKVLERTGRDGKVIKKCQINAVALTMNPVNPDTYVDLVKSLAATNEVDFQATEENLNNIKDSGETSEPIFTTKQVMALLEKALATGAGPALQTPSERSGGDALAQEEMKPKKKMKKMSKDMYKSSINDILDKIQKLYPEASRTQIWEVVKHRMSATFPDDFEQ